MSALVRCSRHAKTRAKGAAKVEEFAFACLEAKGSSVDFREFFQSYVREQRWRIRDEKIAEASWIFSCFLERKELLQFAKEGALAGRVKWTEGKVLLQITAHELDGGFTRVEISARPHGNGQSADRFTPPKDT